MLKWKTENIILKTRLYNSVMISRVFIFIFSHLVLFCFKYKKQKLLKLHYFKASTCEVCARVNVCVWVWDWEGFWVVLHHVEYSLLRKLFLFSFNLSSLRTIQSDLYQRVSSTFDLKSREWVTSLAQLPHFLLSVRPSSSWMLLIPREKGQSSKNRACNTPSQFTSLQSDHDNG